MENCDINTDLTVFDQLIEFWWPSLPSVSIVFSFITSMNPRQTFTPLNWCKLCDARGEKVNTFKLWYETHLCVNKTFKLRLVNLDKF